jgi:S-adenosylmethionine:tRNA ribosyltransferase-isomerase
VDISEFDFALPEEQIAQEPAPERDASRLLVLDGETGATRHERFHALPSFLAPGDLLVLNRSRVFPARLLGRRANGGDAEILLIRPRPSGAWEALLRPGRRLRPGDVVDCGAGVRITVESGALAADGRREVRFDGLSEDVERLVSRVGHTPLPPYIQRAPSAADRERYQTVYAREPGSVAAPTAGLHFTDALLDRLRTVGVEIAELVLHVGPGTFRPVKVQDIADHRVAPEPFEIPEATAAAILRTRARGGRVVAVGTTTVRTLESAGAEGTLRPWTG